MDYVCIKCNARWKHGREADGPSGSLCDKCLVQYIRGKQLFKGYEDCFRRKGVFCPEKECTYFDLCNKGVTSS